MANCGFDWRKDCTEACKYYETCTRNPHNKRGTFKKIAAILNPLHCPCCAGKAGLFKRVRHFTFYAVICEECGLRTADFPTPEMAVEKWNDRRGSK